MGSIKRAHQELMKISEKYESFNEEKVENIVKELIESGVIFTVGIDRALYQYIQRVATKLGYMDIKPMDYLRVADKIC